MYILTGVSFNEVVDGILKYSKCKANFNASNLKKILKDRIAEEITLNNGARRWCLKETFYSNQGLVTSSSGTGRGRKIRFSDEGLSGAVALGNNNNNNNNQDYSAENEMLNIEMQRQYSVEELERSLLPEDV